MTSKPAQSPIQFRFNSQFTDRFEADPEKEVFSRHVEQLYSWVEPTPSPKPSILAHSRDLAAKFGWNASICQSSDFLNIFAGNEIGPGSKPYATCYGGFQFSQWANQLGDGRAINLGELQDLHGQQWTFQLKGAGPTPYSRSADGYAVLRSSIREFVCSEAMFHLGIPTTRALSLISTGKPIVRDMFYDGHAAPEPGAVVCRVSPSFIRFGHFDLLQARDNKELLRELITYCIENDTPELSKSFTGGFDEKALAWYRSICRRTLDLVMQWQSVGFVHGVLNTDNMSIQGLTIDYGPYGWLEETELSWTPNTTDAQGKRYCFGRQPSICFWNLQRLAEAIAPVFTDSSVLRAPMEEYKENFAKRWPLLIHNKLGISPSSKKEGDLFTQQTLDVMIGLNMDWTLFFRTLSQNFSDSDNMVRKLVPCSYRELQEEEQNKLLAWCKDLHGLWEKSERSPEERSLAMKAINPKFIFRNYLAQQAIEQAEKGDLHELQTLLQVLENPFDDQPEFEKYASMRPEWARHKAGCSMLSCSS